MGALIGAAAVLLLTNESVQRALFRTGAKASDAVKSGVEKVRKTAREESKKVKEEHASHPVARAVVDAARERDLQHVTHGEVSYLVAHGMCWLNREDPMSHYIHHVPGRLRVRASTFRCSPARVQTAIRAIEALDGVTSVAFTPRAGSITVHYDPRQRSHVDLLATIEEAGCLQGARQPSTAAGTDVAELFGKAIFGALVQRTAQSLVAAIL